MLGDFPFRDDRNSPRRASLPPTRPFANHRHETMQNAEAGPSTVIGPALRTEPSDHIADAEAAPLRLLPGTHFYSVEYPGYVKPTSVPLAVERLGGQSSVQSAFKRTGYKSGSILELNLRPGNHFAHPIPGDVIPTNNILLKVVKRSRKQKDANTEKSNGEYTVQATGVIPKTARFRSV